MQAKMPNQDVAEFTQNNAQGNFQNPTISSESSIDNIDTYEDAKIGKKSLPNSK